MLIFNVVYINTRISSFALGVALNLVFNHSSSTYT